MTELSNRIGAQRHIVKLVNQKHWKSEQLFALSDSSIKRWALANGIDAETRLVKLLHSASATFFTMANHSDDPIAGEYGLSRSNLAEIERLIAAELGS